MKLAIIGASSGQFPICQKAREMGIETHCFAWPEGAVCKEIVDFFYPISITEKDMIVEKCRQLQIDGVVSNASELTADVVAYVSEKLSLNGTPYNVLKQLHDKFFVRKLSENINGLSTPRYYRYNGEDMGIYPCVVKPCEGSAKSGVSFVDNRENFAIAIRYAQKTTKGGIVVEEYIDGKELSVESISFRGKHQIIQITDKDSSSAPHFVELGHHQPADITISLKRKIEELIPKILEALNYTNGASHIEIKYQGEEIYLIEVNLRGGGDEISNRLVQLSTGIDYLRSMIEIALGTFKSPVRISEPAYAGIYYLCKQTKELLPFFEQSQNEDWIIDRKFQNTELQESFSNYERDGYLIYKSDHKIYPNT